MTTIALHHVQPAQSQRAQSQRAQLQQAELQRAEPHRASLRAAQSAPGADAAHAERAPGRVRTRLTRRGRAVLAALIVLPLLVGGGALLASGGAIAGIQSSSASFRHVTVQPGDSLWSIAQRVAPHDDPRDVIAAFVDLNGLSSGMVMAGEQLAVPHQFDGAGR